MPDRSEEAWGSVERPHRRHRGGLTAAALALASRALKAEADRWFLWLPVLFAGGILTYFALANEPDPRVAMAFVLAALGLCLTFHRAPLGLALAGLFSPSPSASHRQDSHRDGARACARQGAALRPGHRLRRRARAPRQGQGAAHFAGDLLRRPQAGGATLSRAHQHCGQGRRRTEDRRGDRASCNAPAAA
jgi:hypothetical protein